MNSNEQIRIAAMVAVLVAYGGHLYAGSGVSEVVAFGYPTSGFVVVGLLVFLLALPEALDYLPGPFGKTSTSGGGD